MRLLASTAAPPKSSTCRRPSTSARRGVDPQLCAGLEPGADEVGEVPQCVTISNPSVRAVHDNPNSSRASGSANRAPAEPLQRAVVTFQGALGAAAAGGVVRHG